MSKSKNNTWLQDVRFFWAILAIPAIPMALALLSGVGAEELLHPTGEILRPLYDCGDVDITVNVDFPKSALDTMVR